MVAIAGEEPMQEPGGHGDRIFVSVRLRPLNEKETSRNDVSDWECINDTTIIYRNNLSLSERSMYPTAYSFDRVFGTDCSTKRVYEEGAKSVALSVVSGINSSIFAYGQTSSGKTYTMSGITGYTVADIFDYIEKHTEREFNLKFSAMEIYNESVRDLLSADATPLRLLDDPERGTIVERLTEETLRDWEHFNELLSVCEAERQIGETALNEASSRSHQILRLVIESSAREFLGYDKSSSLSAVVNFVDLAGSERASQTLSAGTRLKEGCHINRSLLTLGTVIRKLSKGRNGHVPFRDSKLTRILQSSLGGNARTAIICTMSPAHSHVEQSRNTLLFASCAKEVSTNAQVNVVMSDKALVKHLKKELNRLENELRGSEPRVVPADSSTLLREKDLQIEKLKKEVLELVLQRDLAQCQVKDLVRVLGDDKPSAADLDHYYPKLRVRNTWDIETQTLGAPVLAASHGRTNSVRSFGKSLYSDGDSRTSSEETLLQLPDFEENFLQTDSRQFSVDIPNFIDNNLHQEESKEQSDGNSEDLCKEVRCIEMEVSRRNRYIVSNESDSSASRYQNSNILSPAANIATSGLTVENGVRKNQEHESPLLNRKGFVFPTSEKIPPWLPEKEMLSPLVFKLRRSRSSKARLVTSSSRCWFEMAEKYESTPTVEFEKGYIGRREGFQKKLPSLSYGAEIERLSNGSQASERITAADECKALEAKSTDDECKPQETKSINDQCKPPEEKSMNDECQALDTKSTNDEYQSQETKSTNEECQAQETELTNEECQSLETISTNEECQAQESKSTNGKCQGWEPKSTTERTSFVEETEEMADTQFNQFSDSMVPEADLKPIHFARDVKDVGLDPIPMDEESPSRWSSKFNKLQWEIIELWDTCNVSLVHRTYFFLLFKGDPSDSIYMEVELRRMSFLKNTFSRGNQTLEDGETLTPASSLKALTSERHMLSKQMKRRLSEDERNNLYLKWGISLHSKHRRLQLANLLWSDGRNMDHIMDSATVVSKLVSKVEPEQAFKEMFGLRFAPRDSLSRRRSHFWSDSFKSLV